MVRLRFREQQSHVGQILIYACLERLRHQAPLESDLRGLISISAEQLGADYLNDNDLRMSLTQSGICFTRVVAKKNKGVMGFCLCKIIEGDSIRKHIPMPDKDLPDLLQTENSIGMIGIVATHAEYQGRGIGMQLVKNCLAEFAKREIPVVYSIGWHSSKGVNIGGILENCGFVKLTEVSNYWREDSLKRNYRCPDCGSPPCKCSAVVFAKSLI